MPHDEGPIYPDGEAIEHFRIEAGLTRPRLGELARLNRKTIYGYERSHLWPTGRVTASRESLIRVANVLGVGLYDLVYRKDPKRPEPPPRPTKPKTRPPKKLPDKDEPKKQVA